MSPKIAKPSEYPPAFPVQFTFPAGAEIHYGASLWDYYAASALQGLLANCATNDNNMAWKEFASDAAGYADAMLAERAKRESQQA